MPCVLHRIGLVPSPEDPPQVFGHLLLVHVADLVHHVALQMRRAPLERCIRIDFRDGRVKAGQTVGHDQTDRLYAPFLDGGQHLRPPQRTLVGPVVDADHLARLVLFHPNIT